MSGYEDPAMIATGPPGIRKPATPTARAVSCLAVRGLAIRELVVAAPDDRGPLTASRPIDHDFLPGRMTVVGGGPMLEEALLDVLALRVPPLAGSARLGALDLIALDRAGAGRWRRANLSYPGRMAIPSQSREVLKLIQAELADCEPLAAIPRALDLLARFDLGRRLSARISSLGVEERVMVDFAIALARSPRILLAGDFVEAVGPLRASKLVRALRRHAQVRRAIVIVGTSESAMRAMADDLLDLAWQDRPCPETVQSG